MFKKKKNENLNYILIGIVFIVIVGLITILIFSMNKGKDKKLEKKEKITEEQEIINANKEAIDNAQKSAGTEKLIDKITADDHILGDIDASIQFIIYSDFECPFCAQFAETVKQVKEEFNEKVVIAFRHFPLTTIHASAVDAAIASECAAEQGKFWEMHDKLFEANTTQKFYKTQFKNDAVEIGLDAVQFNKCLDTEKYKDKVLGQMLEGRNSGVSGTPASFVNGQALPGAYPFEDFTDSGGYNRMGMKNIIMNNLE